MLAKSLEDAATALKLGKRWTRGVARHRGTGLAAGKQKCASDRHLMVRRAIKAGRADDGTELLRSDELNPWEMAKLKELL